MVNTLEADWYVDSEIYARERDRIFHPSWWLMGPSHLVSNPGDYLCDRICGWPVFVLRSQDGKLRAFLNVCRHRGATLLTKGYGGGINSVRCPYHGWLYDDHGRLQNTPKFGEELGDEKKSLSLHQIDVHVWNGLVFVKIARDKGVGFDEWLGEVSGLCADFPGPSSLDYYGEFTVEGELNWKTYCDNTVEGYHLNLIHPRLGTALAGGDVQLFSVNDGRSVAFDITHGASGGAREARGAKGLWVYHFPGLQLVLGDKIFKAERVESNNSNHLRSINWAWYGELDEAAKHEAFAWGKQIVEEDFGICAEVTRNLRAGVFTPGPLSPSMEKHVARFQQIVKDILLNGE
ncbi:MAG: aromatic ring-hydroxylating dioxygenase subunit alpha [Gammaproteobacteria bacterium]|nr:aromatic ring-hydroxylating dioxygenase subunit alpha [Gammaproteobacteria bacterium]